MSDYERTDFDRGDVCYALKRHNPAENKHQRGCSPAEVKELTFASLRLQKIMEEVAVETSRDLKDIHADVQALLDEMGHKMMMPAVRTLAMGLRRVFRTVLQGVHVNRGGMEEMKRAIERWPVVLLPSHRSYFDFILVSYIMFEYNIKLPCIAAGQDFMNMSMVSSFLRRSGAFFLRRTFSSDRLYKAVFTEYVQTLLCSCDHPLEFFIEGTRSRTAKSLHPRLGLLSMVVEPYLDGRLPDIFLVPVSISYQRTLEEELFARELLGIPKPKESTKGLFKARSILSQDYGNIFVHISPPVSLHDVCLAKGISRIPHSLFPKAVSVVLPSERQLVLELGHMILDHTHHGMRMFPSAMVAAILLQHSEGIALSDLVGRVESLKEEIVQKGGKLYWEGDTSKVIHSSIEMLSTALELTGDNILQPRTAHKLSVPHRRPSTIQEVIKMDLDDSDYDVITDIGSAHLLLAHYRNQLVHLFVPEAMAALCLHSDMPCDRDTALRRYEALHCALAREFVLPLKNTNELFSESLRALVDRGLVLLLEGSEITVNGQREETVSFLRNLMLPFVAGVWVVCHHLISFSGGVQSLTATIKGAQLLAAKCIQTGLLETFEVLSLEMVRNALASLTQAALILQPSSEVEGRGRLVKVADQEKLVQLAEELGSLLPISCGVTQTAKL